MDEALPSDLAHLHSEVTQASRSLSLGTQLPPHRSSPAHGARPPRRHRLTSPRERSAGDRWPHSQHHGHLLCRNISDGQIPPLVTASSTMGRGTLHTHTASESGGTAAAPACCLALLCGYSGPSTRQEVKRTQMYEDGRAAHRLAGHPLLTLLSPCHINYHPIHQGQNATLTALVLIKKSKLPISAA